MTRPRLRALAGVTLLLTSLGAAPAQDPDCPDQSNAPQCRAETAEPAPAEAEPAEEPGRTTPTQRPTTPPGRATEPTTDTGDPSGRTEDPQPDRGSDTPATSPPTSGAPGGGGDAGPSGGRGTTVGDRGGPGSGTGTDEPATVDEETGRPIPPPPPDLGARRIVGTRLVPGPRGLELAVEVVEARARGVDGGWTVTITGRDPATTVVDAQPREPAGAVGHIIGRDGDRAVPGFTVVGQRSTTVYDADYHGVLPMGSGAPSVITVTLFQ